MAATATQTAAAPAGRPIVFDVRDLPIEAFGGEHGRQTRKFVLLTLATHANSDGTSCYPSVALIGRECGLTARGARKVVSWLRDNRFLQVAYKAGPGQTNLFTVTVRNSSVPEEQKRSLGTETREVRNSSVPGGTERRAQGAERYSSANLPIPTNDLPEKPTKAQKRAPSFVLPSWIPSREWQDFQEMRAKLRKPLTVRACELAVKKLQKLRDNGDEPGDVLNESTLNGWQGLFPLKRNGNDGKRTAQRDIGKIDYSKGLEVAAASGVGEF